MGFIYGFMGVFRDVGLRVCGKRLKARAARRFRKAFPGAEAEWIDAQVTRHFEIMSWFAAEFIKDISAVSGAKSRKDVIENPELLDQVMQSGPVTVCYCAHVYNYEKLIQAMASHDICDVYAVYNRVKFPLIDMAIRHKRSQGGVAYPHGAYRLGHKPAA